MFDVQYTGSSLLFVFIVYRNVFFLCQTLCYDCVITPALTHSSHGC